MMATEEQKRNFKARALSKIPSHFLSGRGVRSGLYPIFGRSMNESRINNYR